MARSKVARVVCRNLQAIRTPPTVLLPRMSAAPAVMRPAPNYSVPVGSRRFISSTANRSGITPDDKAPKSPEPTRVLKTPADISEGTYHSVADDYLDKLLSRLEELQDQREDVDVEYSAGVLTLALGSDVGTYVINKQPPNKQIWLSSPKTGPKRYDYVIIGEGQHEKQDTATGDWVYLRDGTTLNDLLAEEIGIDLGGFVDTELGS
ncbi:hypothetical protein C8A05DRAFT_17154 [Staphylotrichum tortipilum]|uniref:ferroxidase n=1 Tax=Staphylotrichum tortipilum TaxID=2831512 RepID=A0AAN6MHZ4_9PEZI|nr:hypothetical protein C8A05DRAFT_17154 [Staphylotrichum longicolle]